MTGEDSDGTLLAFEKHLFLNKTSPPVANTTISGLLSNKPHKDVKTSSSSTTMDVTSGIYDESVLFQMAVLPVLFKSSDWLEGQSFARINPNGGHKVCL